MKAPLPENRPWTTAARPSASHQMRGVSLLELMAGVAIVAVLVSLTSAAYMRVTDNGNRLDSITRLRNLGIAVSMYAADHDQFLPGPLKFNQYAYLDGETGNQLSYRLQDYIETAKLKFGDRVPALGHRKFFTLSDPTTTVAYIPNLMRMGPDNTHAWGYTSKGTLPQKVLYVPHPNGVVAIMETDAKLLTSGGTPASADRGAPEPYFQDGRAALYFDWHVDIKPLSYRLGDELTNN